MPLSTCSSEIRAADLQIALDCVLHIGLLNPWTGKHTGVPAECDFKPVENKTLNDWFRTFIRQIGGLYYSDKTMVATEKKKPRYCGCYFVAPFLFRSCLFTLSECFAGHSRPKAQNGKSDLATTPTKRHQMQRARSSDRSTLFNACFRRR